MANDDNQGDQPLGTQHHQPDALNAPRGPMQRLRRVMLGRPIETSSQLAHRLPIFLALPMLAADALSSTPTPAEEILLMLATAQRFIGDESVLRLLIPISIAIAIMNADHRHELPPRGAPLPESGGSYTVSRRTSARSRA